MTMDPEEEMHSTLEGTVTQDVVVDGMNMGLKDNMNKGMVDLMNTGVEGEMSIQVEVEMIMVRGEVNNAHSVQVDIINTVVVDITVMELDFDMTRVMAREEKIQTRKKGGIIGNNHKGHIETERMEESNKKDVWDTRLLKNCWKENPQKWQSL